MRAKIERHPQTGTFSNQAVPAVISITAKWVFVLKTDREGSITKTKARLVACGADYLETFAATSSLSSIKVALGVAVKNDWPPHQFDVTQAFVRAPLDADVFMELPMARGRRTGDVLKPDRALSG